MRHKIRFFNLILILVFIFSFAACTTETAKEPTISVAFAKSKIAFVSDRDGNFEIYIMNADGSGLVNLTNNPAYDGEPSFSP